jgi:hypothetical protein
MEFIYRRENVLSKEQCDEIIQKFEESDFKLAGITASGVNESIKKSTDLTFHHNTLDDENINNLWGETVHKIVRDLNYHMNKYKEENEYLKFFKIEMDSFNVQKYEPNGGFYTWHCETIHCLDRVTAWMIYLNDVEDGGTEFMKQKHTEKAEAGKLIIWPADWTHAHRGEVSTTKTKYILTGWFSQK